ncbi:ribosome silencing factor [Asaia krungthepensis]|uniref:ribosome silencing factor n=1 Tax=Asaia krungthepensis TaxID=220990 RepID=UPI00222EAC42|nr:ribosome silencing factor [Asaia krungthepensis]
MKTAGTPRKKAAAAGPRKTRTAPREGAKRELVEKALVVITTSLDEDKAEDIVTLDLRGRASFADHMVVATGIADRQIAAMASHIEDKLNEIGIKRITIEGANGTDWVLLDTGDIVVHLFKPESRALYALERMWGKDLDDSATDDADTTDL